MSRFGAHLRWIAGLVLAATLLSPAADADTIRVLTLPTRDLVYDPYTLQIFASVPSSAGASGNSMTVINPLAGAVQASFFVGSEPGKLALSDDGRLLYIALDGAGAVRPFQLSTATAGPQFSLGNNPIFGPYFVEDMQVLPGRAESVAIARQLPQVSSRHAGIVILDNGTPRPMATEEYPICNSIQFDDAGQRLFGYENESTGFFFSTLRVAPAGVSPLNSTPGLISGLGETIRYDAGRIYATTGQVIDPAARMVVGTFPGIKSPALVQPDSATGRVFFLSRISSTWTLLAFDSHTLQPTGTLPIPGVSGDPGSLIRWGPDGLAFRTSLNRVFLIRTSLVPVAELSAAIAPAAVVGGARAVGRVTLAAPAPAGGAEVRLTSADPAVPVPAVLDLPAGATVATFPVTPSPVNASRDVLVTASMGATTASAHLRLLAPVPDSLTFAPGAVRSGGGSTATVGLSGPASAGGLKVWLSTANPTVATVPDSVTIPAGATTGTFPLSTYSVAEKSSVLISASTPEGIYSSPFQVTPPIIQSLTFDPARVVGGDPTTGTVTLADPAPPGGIALQLYNGDPEPRLPDRITVPAGALSASFPVTTTLEPYTYTAFISARLGTQSVSQTLVVLGPDPVSFTLEPSTVIGGDAVAGRVTLSLPEPARGGWITFQSDPYLAHGPGRIVLAAGESSATITLMTDPVTVPTRVRIAAATGTVMEAFLLLLPRPAASITLAPSSVTGGETAAGTVTLAAPAPPGGTVVDLASDNAAAAVPPHVKVVAGASAALFPIATQPVASAAAVRISATWGAGTASATLALRPPALTSIRTQPDRSPGGLPVTINVTLDGPAPAGGTTVHLTSNHPAAPVPPQIVVPPGASTTSYTLLTKPVSASVAVDITATAGGQWRDWTLVLTPVAVQSFSLDPAVTAGRMSTGSLTLSAPAPAGGMAIKLVSDPPGVAQVPALITIPAGMTMFPFRVSAATSVSLAARLRGDTQSAALQVVPR